MKQLYVGTSEAGQYQLNENGLKKIGQVILWSCASTFVATLIALVPEVDIPVVWMWVVPIVNTVLVSVKKFIEKQ